MKDSIDHIKKMPIIRCRDGKAYGQPRCEAGLQGVNRRFYLWFPCIYQKFLDNRKAKEYNGANGGVVMEYKSMGDLISELRKQQNMTQKDLANELNVTDKAVSKWERDISCPDIHTIPKLAEILNISSEELLCFQKNTSQTVAQNHEMTFHKKVIQISALVFKAVGMAMGIAVLVLSILGDISTNSAITMLSIGITCIGIAQFQNK